MFSLIKKIQELLNSLKRNKGLFFTVLSILSISGIALFMFLIMTMTSRIEKDVHDSISNNNIKSLEILLQSKKNHYKQLGNTILSEDNIINYIKSNEKEQIQLYEKKYNNLYKIGQNYPIEIKFYPILDKDANFRDTITNLLRNKSELFGVETQRDGVFIVYIKPILSDGNFIGLLEMKQSIHNLKVNYNLKDSFFMFIMDKKMLVKLSLKSKSGKFKNVVSNYIVKKGVYSSRFYSKMTEIDDKAFKASLKNTYDNDDKFFRSYTVVTDINGVEIGLFVFGDYIEKNNGFVSLADKMVKSVTYVSLGLVVSILLFMF